MSTNALLKLGSIESLIRQHNITILEITDNSVVFQKTGLYDETQRLFDELQQSIGVLQFIRSGRVAITRSKVERLSDMLEQIEKIRERKSKHA